MTASNPDKPDREPGSSATPAGGADPGPGGLSDDERDPTRLRAALLEAEAAAEENWNKYLRSVAELENMRKRAVREAENARKFGVERFAAELLAVVDSLEMGLEAGPAASAEALLEGKAATLKLLHSAMDKAGITVIDPVGEPFNPQLHEAMSMQPSDTAEPDSVLAVVQKGYELNGRLLRPARVIVAKEPAA